MSEQPNWQELLGVSAAEQTLLARLFANEPAAVEEVVVRARSLAQSAWAEFSSSPAPEDKATIAPPVGDTIAPPASDTIAPPSADVLADMDEFGEEEQRTTYEAAPAFQQPLPAEMFVKQQTIIGIGLEPEPPAPAVELDADLPSVEFFDGNRPGTEIPIEEAPEVEVMDMTLEVDDLEMMTIDGFDEVSPSDATAHSVPEVAALEALDALDAPTEAQPKKPGLFKRIFRLSKEPPVSGGES